MIENVIATLATPEAWTKGAYARTALGRTIGFECVNAKCFCMLGATYRATPADAPADAPADSDDLEKRSLSFMAAAIRELFPARAGNGHIPRFNDHPDTTHEDVLRVLRRARELELAVAE